ncbi:Tfp pilus assembly protein FimT [Ralstonia pickettii]|jgi:type IV fimbrial biogenesis protein FimT|nr:general secretion pathway protein H [Ralstonia sp. 5_2_56FAA]SCW73781.1 type IV fimbrial biogenesis protein FimT [Ralstonia sp. UNCCL144]SUE00389.1 Tfp pilus assembly protein FimT [Ralstonia pickettii]
MAAAVRNHLTAHQLQSSRNRWSGYQGEWRGEAVGVRADKVSCHSQIDTDMSHPNGRSGVRGRADCIRSKRIQGVSLVELMVTLAIVAVLAVIATPSYVGLTQRTRLQAEANSLVNDLQFARSEAIKRGQPVSLCPSSNGTACNTTNTSNWEAGWIVFNDINGSGTTDSTSDVPLRVRGPLPSGDTFRPSPAASAVTYNRDGFATNLINGTVTMTLHTAAPVNDSATRCVAINMVGRQIVQTKGTGACN